MKRAALASLLLVGFAHAADYKVAGGIQTGVQSIFEEKGKLVVQFLTPPSNAEVRDKTGERIPVIRTGRFIVLPDVRDDFNVTTDGKAVRIASVALLDREEAARLAREQAERLEMQRREEAERKAKAEAEAARLAQEKAELDALAAKLAREKATGSVKSGGQQLARSDIEAARAELHAAEKLSTERENCPWEIKPEDMYLSVTMKRWSDQAGWQVPFWEASDPVVERGARLCGDVFTAINQVLTAYAQTTNSIRLVFHEGNKAPQFVTGAK